MGGRRGVAFFEDETIDVEKSDRSTY